MKIGLVGTCAAGKSTIGAMLTKDGFEVRQIAQEHSYVQDMWQRISNPDCLIYLDVDYENTLLRRNINWTIRDYHQQLQRLSHAREHADLIIDTNDKTAAEVYEIVLAFLSN